MGRPVDSLDPTPGPWSTLPCSAGGLIVVRGTRETTAQHMMQVVPAADAFLVSAAPDMKKALLIAQEFIRNQAQPMTGEADLVLVQIAVALRKANGGDK